jgi:beta-glucosidase
MGHPFHWDLPYKLYNRGGWLYPDSPQWFADYTRTIA